MTIEATTRKWGSSIGVILPKEFVEKHRIKPNEKIHLDIIKAADLSHIFGSLPRVRSGQDFKDMVRKGWG